MKRVLIMNDQPLLTHDELRQFTGDLDRYRHPLNPKVIYTPGIKHMAERGGAYWLIDVVVSYVGTPVMQQAIADDGRLADL